MKGERRIHSIGAEKETYGAGLIMKSKMNSKCVIPFFVIKRTRCTNFTNLFCHETLHVSDSSPVYHQEFIHCTLSNGMYHTGL